MKLWIVIISYVAIHLMLQKRKKFNLYTVKQYSPPIICKTI